jgi:hypothetical protein
MSLFPFISVSAMTSILQLVSHSLGQLGSSVVSFPPFSTSSEKVHCMLGGADLAGSELMPCPQPRSKGKGGIDVADRHTQRKYKC